MSLLFPMWQLVIGVVVAAVLLLSVGRLARRGPSRMSRALIVTGGAALALAALGILMASH